MSALSRRRIVAGLIVLYLVWPLIQQQLVRVYRVDPWKFAGWAMYTAPNARVRIHLFGVDTTEQVVHLSWRMSSGLRSAVSEYAHSRRTLGLFVQPEPIANQLLIDRPDFREWTIVVEQVGLTPRNHFGVIHRSRYRYANVAGKLGPVEVRSQLEADRVQENDTM